MTQTPDEADVLARMAPGVLCREGFLGSDPRPLSEIIDTDAATVDRLGITHERIADRLAEVYELARGAFGGPVNIGLDRLAVWREAMGRIPSPWPGSGVFAKGEVELTLPATGETIRFTPLAIHLIRTRGFYQGRGSRYRLEPEQLAHALGVA